MYQRTKIPTQTSTIAPPIPIPTHRANNVVFLFDEPGGAASGVKLTGGAVVVEFTGVVGLVALSAGREGNGGEGVAGGKDGRSPPTGGKDIAGVQCSDFRGVF